MPLRNVRALTFPTKREFNLCGEYGVLFIYLFFPGLEDLTNDKQVVITEPYPNPRMMHSSHS